MTWGAVLYSPWTVGAVFFDSLITVEAVPYCVVTVEAVGAVSYSLGSVEAVLYRLMTVVQSCTVFTTVEQS